MTKEHRDKISLANKLSWINKPEKEKMERIQKLSRITKQLWQDPEYIEKMKLRYRGTGMTGKRHSEETKRQISERKKGNVHLSTESRRKVSESLKKAYTSGKRTLGMKGRKHSLEIRKKMSESQLRVRQYPEVVLRIIKGQHRKPNKPELALQNLLNNLLPGEYHYTGDGKIIIDGKCPDFLNMNGQKKLIELYGTYWHKGQDPQDRIALFKKFSFDTLVVWENELKDTETLKIKILEFHNKPHEEPDKVLQEILV